MTDTKKLLDLAVELSGVVLCGMAILMVLVMSQFDRRTRRCFLWYFIGCGLLSAANMAGLLMRGRPGPGWRAALYVSNYVEFLLPTALAVLVTWYMLGILDPAREKNALRWGIVSLGLLHTVLLSVSQFTGLYYILDADNLYRRQPLYPLSFVCTGLILLNDLAVLLRHREKFTRREFSVFLVYFFLPALSILPQLMQYGINFTIFSTIIAGLVMCLFLVSDQTERYEQTLLENARRESEALLLQMRPHFIYNTMTSIYYLCGSDPPLAQQVCGDFTAYLQSAFTALGDREPIPFIKELKHTRAYLAVEQARYPDRIDVCFDTAYTAFRLPALTLQPLVENAVKHGLDPNCGALHLVIRTRALEDGSELTVEDDGVGFLAGAESGGEHSALENIRSRLAFCGGSLSITPREGGGAVVTVTVPALKCS